ncbi:MAG: class I SAM-dependent methyltransferase [Candidatus Hermodarchaeota archaeon]
MSSEELSYRYRESFLKYTRKAFSLLPEMNKPLILDVGCGTGVATIELFKLSNGKIIGIDINQDALDKFKKRIEEENLPNEITIMNCNLLETNFSDESFDLIWAEGVIYIIGFQKGFKACFRLLKKGGFLVLHEALIGLRKNTHLIKKCGFQVFDKFFLPEGAWWNEYYEPLEKEIDQLNEDGLSQDILKEINQIKHEINLVKSYRPKELNCAFYILQKI